MENMNPFAGQAVSDEDEHQYEENTQPPEPTAPTPSSDPNDYVIEEDVPVPAVLRRRYPFDQMAVGHSFAVSADPEDVQELGSTHALRRVRSSLSSSAASYMKRNPHVNLIVRKVDETTVRCWRVANSET